MKETTYQGFEQGPIRPPSEANSLLLRLSRNCPWNKCTFCGLYKGRQFTVRPVEHILHDIDMVHFYTEWLESNAEPIDKDDRDPIHPSGTEVDPHVLSVARAFIANGKKAVFFQDGNSLVMKPKNILRILHHLQDTFPQIERITTYARAQTISRINPDHLKAMADAGLNRIHIGLESGSDTVLQMVKKGSSKATQIEAGLKVKAAGIQLSEYVMPGLGGRLLSEEHALETADAINQINPDFVRIRSLALPPDTPLAAASAKSEFSKMDDIETTKELLLFLEQLGNISRTIRSDHVLNLFPEVDGTLPEERDKLLTPVKRFLTLSIEEQMLFCVGRRSHKFARLTDLQTPVRRKSALRTFQQLGVTTENFHSIINSLMARFV